MSWIPDRDANGNFIIRGGAFASDEGLNFRGTGISATATAGTTTNIDYKMPQDSFINGVQLLVKNQAFGDSVDFQVVDKDNILGLGAGTVLNQFGTDWYICEQHQKQDSVIIPYPALIRKDLYIRIVYKSVGANNVTVNTNLYLHEKPTVA